jgi:hypothetical protein
MSVVVNFTQGEKSKILCYGKSQQDITISCCRVTLGIWCIALDKHFRHAEYMFRCMLADRLVASQQPIAYNGLKWARRKTGTD